MRIVLNIILCVVIVAGGAIAVWLVFDSEPVAQQQSAVAETAMLVETTGVEHGTFRPTIRAMGRVEAAQEVTLSARVPGHVERVAERFEPGSLVGEGDLLVELDRDDFENLIEQQRAAVEEARAAVLIEEGLQDVARSELELFGITSVDTDWADDRLSDDDRQLVLREPQREAAEARLDAAEAALRQARLELERTRVRAPFDARVMSRDVNLGSQIAPGEALGHLVGTDHYWVIAAVPASKLRWLDFAADEGPSSAPAPTDWEPNARVRDRTAWPEGVYRDAHLLRRFGSLEEGTRLARVLLEVSDPLARTEDNQGLEPLILGAFVRVELLARPVSDVIRIDRSLVRAGDTVWVMEDGQLSIRSVEVVFSDERYAYVSEGLAPDDQIVVTNLATVRDGAPLRLEEADGTGSGDGGGL